MMDDYARPPLLTSEIVKFWWSFMNISKKYIGFVKYLTNMKNRRDKFLIIKPFFIKEAKLGA